MPAPRFSPVILFGRRWWWVTLLILASMALMYRLGIWQLDRLKQRQAANAVLRGQLAAPSLSLNRPDVSLDVAALTNRQVEAAGIYDLSNQLFLVQQRYQGQLGMHLLTPLRLAGSDWAILVDRGWIPSTAEGFEAWPDFPVTEPVQLLGYIQPPETLPNGLTETIVGLRTEWFRVDIAGIQQQLPYPLLPYYLRLKPPENGLSLPTAPPYLEPIEFDISDGSHLGYAIQWFSFTLILGAGYIYFVRKQTTASPAQSQ